MFGTHKAFAGRMRPACQGLDHAGLSHNSEPHVVSFCIVLVMSSYQTLVFNQRQISRGIYFAP